MPEWLKDLTGAAAVIVVVIVFLKFLSLLMSNYRKERDEQSKDCHDTHKTVAKSFERIVESNSGVIRENSKAIGANTAFLQKLTNGGKKG